MYFIRTPPNTGHTIYIMPQFREKRGFSGYDQLSLTRDNYLCTYAFICSVETPTWNVLNRKNRENKKKEVAACMPWSFPSFLSQNENYASEEVSFESKDTQNNLIFSYAYFHIHCFNASTINSTETQHFLTWKNWLFFVFHLFCLNMG